ncbi:DUF2905 domain-containing protein [Niveibacterium terrae]|uniref:DUF2905 domain-containing protein n=1 Tax=Niveibacterium terrae TaxID=3373598 RepID=UPI003A8D4081
MLKWLLVSLVVSIVASSPALRRRFPNGFPGDLRIRIGRREIRIALGLSLLLTALAAMLLRRL